MKKIPLRTVKTVFIEGQEPATLHYATFMRQMLHQGGAAGLSTEDGLRGSDIARVIRRADEDKKDAVLLEDAQHEFLVKKLNEFRWNSFSFEIADFCRDITDAETVDPNAEAPKPADEVAEKPGG